MRTCVSRAYFTGLTVLGLGFALPGCRTVESGVCVPDLTLSADEHVFSQALAHFAQGLIYEKELGKASPEALEHYTEAAGLDPKSHRLYTKVAVACLHQKLPNRAIEVLEKSCSEDPSSVQARVELATACQVTGHTDLAIEHYARAARLDPAETALYVALANLLFYENRDSRAIRVLKKGFRKAGQPSRLIAYCYQQGTKFIRSGEIPRSIPCFQLLARNVPSQRQQFYHLLGDLYETLGHEEEALRNFTLATKGDSPLPDSFVRLAFIRLRSSSAKAVQTLRSADRRMPNNPAILFPLAYIQSTENQFEEALSLFERVKQIVNQSEEQKLTANFYLYYGATCNRAGKIKEAEKSFEECLEFYPESHRVLNCLAYMWAQRGVKLDKAHKYVSLALERDPKNGAYLDTLGWIYYRQRNYTKALELIEKAHTQMTNDPTIADHLGDIFNALGDRERAVSYWKKSLLLDPENEAVARKLETHRVNLDELRMQTARNGKQGGGQ